jgi:Dirigent-like protein
MPRRFGFAVASCCAAAAVVLGGDAIASTSSEQPFQVIKAISRATAINDFVDTGPSGSSTGDLYVFSDKLFDAAAPDHLIGRADGRCTLIDPATLRFGCSITSSLSGGDVMTEGTLTLVQGTQSTGAVVGGTGTFRLARGQATLDLGPFQGPHQVEYDLVLHP